jgi:hypothetical protein
VTKTCTKCHLEKPVSEFSKNRGTKDGYFTWCKPCSREKATSYYRQNRELVASRRAAAYAADPEKYKAASRGYRKSHRDYHIRRYGITAEQFDQILERQGGCAICGTTEVGEGSRGWHVDHDHACCPTKARSCGACVRGILCADCNNAIGFMQDDPRRLRAAAEYLEGEHDLLGLGLRVVAT